MRDVQILQRGLIDFVFMVVLLTKKQHRPLTLGRQKPWFCQYRRRLLGRLEHWDGQHLVQVSIADLQILCQQHLEIGRAHV